MRLFISHRASDLLHAPMYRLYRNKPDTAAYIIRECHVVDDIFKYQVVASVSTKALTIPEEREVLKQLRIMSCHLSRKVFYSNHCLTIL